MDQAALHRHLMGVFLGELEEHVRALNDGLLALEKEPVGEERAEHLKRLFRAAHSLKGSAGAVNVKPIEMVCHSLEEILGAARDGSITLGPEHFEVIYAAADAIADAGVRLRAQRDLSDAPISAIAPRLASAARATTDVGTPASGPPPVRAAARELERPAHRPLDEAAPIGQFVDAGLVRVPVGKLDDILARGGELLLARHRLDLRVQAVDTLHRFVDEWMEEWTAVDRLATEFGPDVNAASSDDARLAEQLRECLPLLGAASENMRRLERELKRLGGLLAQDSRALNVVAGRLDHEVRNIRMFPLSEACAGLERLARDLARGGGKDVDLTVDGGQLELDRTVLEAIKDPLVHLVRNAIDHGIETPDERLAAGKSSRGQLRISAALHGAQVEVVISDDGRGLDLNAIRAKAQTKKLPVPEDDADVAQLIFLPGFSTAPLITEISGRGVGLDVVASKVARLNGSVDVSFEAGRGTRFTLTLPRTVTRLRALLVRDGGRVYAFNASAVARVVSVRQADIRMIEGRDVILTGTAPVPVVRLAQTLGLPSRSPSTTGKISAVILARGEREAAFAVDELIAEQEVFIKNLGVRLGRVGQVSGATIMPNGSVALILSASGLLNEALGKPGPGTVAASLGETSPPARKRLLVVDDSVTTRTLMQSVLDAAGYDVTVVVDGADAWSMLQERGADFDLVVSDIEMPRMDGFALTQAIRSSSHVADLPVVLVTARSSDEDKARGMEVGANAYLVKSTFDQNALLDTIAQLL
jgi:two-component system chemotaxis sensor kinase CheA